MPSYMFKCEGCGGARPFVLQENETRESVTRDGVRRHCPTCRTTTHWVIEFFERRAGADRRTGFDRRTA